MSVPVSRSRPGGSTLRGPAVSVVLLALATAVPASAQPRPQERYSGEIRALVAIPGVRAAFEQVEVDDARTMRDLIELTEIPAPPFMEEVRAAEFARRLRDAGADSVWIDDEGNVLALRRARAPERAGTPDSGGAVVISGHLDTVFPEDTDVTVRQAGDTLRGPGIGDDTRGLAALLAILRALEATGIRTDRDILFVATVGEEGLGDLRGVKHLFREGGPAISSFISIDGTGSDRITHMGLGSHRYRVTFRGPGGHSWGAFGLANPAHALARSIRYFEAGADPFTREGARTSYNVGRIGGGTSVNSVPFEAWMEVDMRSESPVRLARIDSIFQGAMRRALEEANEIRRSGEPLTLEVDMIGDRPSGEIPESDPLVQRAIAATVHFDRLPALTRSSTDANVPISLGIPAITIGGGGVGGGAHSLDEWFMNRNGVLGVQRALLILLAQAGLSGEG